MLTFTMRFRVNLLGQFDPLICQGGRGFDNIKFTIAGSSKLFRDFTLNSHFVGALICINQKSINRQNLLHLAFYRKKKSDVVKRIRALHFKILLSRWNRFCIHLAIILR